MSVCPPWSIVLLATLALSGCQEPPARLPADAALPQGDAASRLQILLFGQTTLVPGTRAWLRAHVARGEAWLTRPVEGASLRVSLTGLGVSHLLGQAEADAQGNLACPLDVPPQLKDGRYRLDAIVDVEGAPSSHKVQVMVQGHPLLGMLLARDTVRAGERALILARAVRPIGGAPVQGLELQLRLKSQEGGLLLLDRARTDQLGEAHWDIPLSPSLDTGVSLLTIQAGESQAHAYLRILPPLDGGLSLTLHPEASGSEVRGRALLTRGGVGLAGCRVEARLKLHGQAASLSRAVGTTGADGAYAYSMSLPPKIQAPLVLVVEATTLRGLRVREWRYLSPSPTQLLICTPGGRVPVGQPWPVSLLMAGSSGRPLGGKASLWVGGRAQEVHLNDDGYGEAQLPPQAESAFPLPLRAVAGAAQVERSVDLARGPLAGLRVPALVRAGEEISLALPATSRPVWVDLVARGQTVSLGGAGGPLVVPEDLVGQATVMVYTLDTSGQVVGTARSLEVMPAGEGALSLELPGPWVPGGEGRLSVRPSREGAYVGLVVAEAGGSLAGKLDPAVSLAEEITKELRLRPAGLRGRLLAGLVSCQGPDLALPWLVNPLAQGQTMEGRAHSQPDDRFFWPWPQGRPGRTLVYRHGVELDGEGQAAFTVPLPAGEGRYDILAWAVGPEGGLETARRTVEVRATSPSLDLPPYLVLGDEIKLPLPGEAALRPRASAGLEVRLASGQGTFHAMGLGKQTLALEDQAGALVWSGGVEVIPSQKDHGRARGVWAQRGAVLQAPKGGMLRLVGSLPALALRGMEGPDKRGVLTEAARLRVATLAGEGALGPSLQALASLEVAGGGLEEEGRSPASVVSTAYGLLGLAGLDADHPMVTDLRVGLLNYLTRGYQRTGHWVLSTASISRMLLRWPEDMPLHLPETALVARALQAAGAPQRDITGPRRFLSEGARQVRDPYLMALTALALETSDPARAGLLKGLRGLARAEAEGLCWSTPLRTLSGARGLAARIETTALAVRALGSGAEAQKGASFLLSTLEPDGTWASPHSTAEALEALAALGPVRAGDINVKLAGAPLTLVPGEEVPWPEGIDALKVEAPGAPGALVLLREKEAVVEEGLSLEVDLHPRRPSLGEGSRLSVKVLGSLPSPDGPVMVTIMVPSVMSLSPQALAKALGEAGRVMLVSYDGARVVLRASSDLALVLPLEATREGRATLPAVVAWEEGNPALRAESEPLAVEVGPPL